MNISGKQVFKDVSPESLWSALHNTDILQKVIPGCESMTSLAGDEYEVKLKLGIAAVKGEYVGKVRIEDVEENHHYILYANGSGAPGHIDMKMDCKLVNTDAGTALEWECNADVGGMIASVGSRVLGGIAKYLAGNFFKDLEKQIKENYNLI